MPKKRKISVLLLKTTLIMIVKCPMKKKKLWTQTHEMMLKIKTKKLIKARKLGKVSKKKNIKK